MKEINIDKAVKVCQELKKCREKIQVINSIKNISKESSRLDIDVRVKDGVNSTVIKTIDVSMLGEKMMEWLISREKLRLQGRIIELEAELSKM